MKRLLPCLLAVLFLGACALVEPEHDVSEEVLASDSSEWDAALAALGDAYFVVEGSPRRTHDSLYATVRYSGGCAPHEFTSHLRTIGKQPVVLLEHDAHGDPCRAWLQDHLRVPLPSETPDDSGLLLLTPDSVLVLLSFVGQ